jgi:hypothetical protein
MVLLGRDNLGRFCFLDFFALCEIWRWTDTQGYSKHTGDSSLGILNWWFSTVEINFYPCHRQGKKMEACTTWQAKSDHVHVGHPCINI